MDNLQMDSQQTFSILLERLGYRSSPNFLSKDSSQESIPAELEVTWREAKDKLGIDAVYFVANAPVIYFKQFEAYEQTKIAELHCRVWNQSQVPLVFVILPGDIRVYNGYKAPRRTRKKELTEPPRLDYELDSQHQEQPTQLWEDPSLQLWERLEIFSRTAIDSGSFWRDYSDHFNRETRADQALLANLSYIRRHLIEHEPNLKPEYAHNLIGRSIFALYLQDRGILPEGEDGFFAREFSGRYSRYTDLLTSHDDTYAFFTFLRERFDGDMFPTTGEEKAAVLPEHLRTLQRLFTTDSTRGGQMLFFWAYNFAFIPIELISAIYEEFLYQEESGQNGAYYTPPMLVDFILNQVLPRNEQHYNLRVLDPACGSGIFLVEAYRRLVERWRKANKRDPQHQELITLLKDSIFGVDIKLQALRIAAFSLYLAMLDYIEPKTIWLKVQFPSLININLVEADFFEARVTFKDEKFDLVVGNPPWESQLTSHAQTFLTMRGYKVGDKQIAQAFLWHAPDYCHSHSQIALLCSSKSLLFNRSGPNIDFRRSFFRKFTVTKVFDFSALRRFLFEKGIAPAAVIFYTPEHPNSKMRIFYGAPKPTRLSRSLAAIVIEANDLKQLPMWQVWDSIESMRNNRTDPTPVKQKELFGDEDNNNYTLNIWKVALWGTNYDYTLLQALNGYPSLSEVRMARGWPPPAGGFNQSGPGDLQYFEWLDEAVFLDAEDFTRYGIDKRRLRTLPKNGRYYRGGNPLLFKAPVVLFKRGQAQRRPSAAFADVDFTYTTAITGIAGPQEDSKLLKALTALLNSDLAQYFWFLTSSSWGVEREEITAGEFKRLPFPFLDVSNSQIDAIATLVDNLSQLITDQIGDETEFIFQAPFNKKEQQIETLERELNNQIYNCFSLEAREIQHIDETVEYTIDFFNSPQKSIALQKPTLERRVSYAEAYIQTINFYLEPIGKKIVARVSDEEIGSLFLVQFYTTAKDANISGVQVFHPDARIRRSLFRLQQLDMEPISRSLFHRRNLRIYDKEEDVIYIAKPAEQRFWTIGMALSDAGETMAEFAQPKRVLT